MNLRARLLALTLLLAAAGCDTTGGIATGSAATPPPVVAGDLKIESLSFQASDGVLLHAWLGGEHDLRPRPVIIEFSPYAPACCGNDFGPDYNYVQVHARGTGLSSGVWTAVGPRDQQDVEEFLAWACTQPWSNGHIGLYGFSASAIAIYNSLHLPLACVDAAALMAGSANLYRDLLYPGGIPNTGPGAVVAFGVGTPLLAAGLTEAQNGEFPPPATQAGAGFMGTIADILLHSTEDDYWLGHTQRPGANTFPVLADTSFYDPESRGPFESFKMLRAHGAHFMTYGAHDGFPANSGGPFPHYQRWFDHYLLGVNNGIERDPVVQLLLGNGSREALLSGDFTRVNAADWPVPGTRWQALFLDAAKAGSANSINDGTLSASAPLTESTDAYLSVPSLPTATDPHTTSTVAGVGYGPLSFGALFNAIPALTQMNSTDPVALTWTTPAFAQAVDSAGPAALDIFLATTSPEADLHAVIADVWPDGNAWPVAQGRLRISFPDIVAAQSVNDVNGEVVQPYGDFSAKQYAVPGQLREYHVEFWPIGNHFAAGHRLRLYLVGASGYMMPSIPGINLAHAGGATPSRLLLPVLPGSDAIAAMISAP